MEDKNKLTLSKKIEGEITPKTSNRDKKEYVFNDESKINISAPKGSTNEEELELLLEEALEEDKPFSDEEKAKYLIQLSRFVAFQILASYIFNEEVEKLPKLTRSVIKYYKNNSTENLVEFGKQIDGQENPFKFPVNYSLVKKILTNYATNEEYIKTITNKVFLKEKNKQATSFNAFVLLYLFTAEFLLQKRDKLLLIKEFNNLANLFIEQGEISFITASINKISDEIEGV